MKSLGFLVFIITFLAYVINLSPTITSDDSGELAGVCHTLGIAHSPGYPLYSLMGKIINTIIPFSNAAYKANLMSALTTAAGIGILYLLLLKISSSVVISFFVSLLCGISFFIYDMATVTEVYGIMILISALLLYVAFSHIPTTKTYLLFYLLGIGFAAHYIIGMWLPAIIWKVYADRRNQGIASFLREITIAMIFFSLGATIFLYIWIRATTDPVYSWEDPKTLERFLQVVLRFRYGALNLTQGRLNFFDFSLWLDKIRFLLRSLNNGFSITGILCGLAGLLFSFRKKSRIDGIFIFLLFAGAGPVFLFLANVRLDEASEALLLRFFYLMAIVWGIYITIALKDLKKTGIIIAAFVLAIIIIKTLCLSNRYHFTFYDYANNLLKNTPRNSIVFFDRADEMEFCVSYLLRVAKKRPDIEFYDCNAGVSKSIYGNKYYKIWGPPRLAIRNQVESDIIRKTNKNVLYATFLPAQTTTPKRPHGLLHITKFNGIIPDISDEIFIIRKPQDEIRSKGLYFSHFQLLGDYYLSQNMTDFADRNFANIFYNGNNPYPYYKLGYQYYSQSNLKKAAAYFEKIVEFFPQSSDALVNLGVISKKEGRNEESKIYYQKAIAVDENNENAYYNLGVYYWEKSDWKNALKNFEKALELNPERTDIKRFISMAQRNLSHPRQ